MQRLGISTGLCLIATLLIITDVRQTCAQTPEVKVKEESVRAGRLTSGETVRVAPGDAVKLKQVRRNPSLKIIKEERPVGRRPAAPRLEYNEGFARAREAVSPREAFGGKQPRP